MSANTYALPTVGCTVYFDTRQVTDASGVPLHLTAAEFDALELLIAERGSAVSRERLFEAALHRRGCSPAINRSVDQIVYNLRRKLGLGIGGIQSVRVAGYLLPRGV